MSSQCLAARWIRRLGLIVVSVCWVGQAPAERIPTRFDDPFLVDAWEAEDGLPGNSVRSLAQTPDGYLWVGTFSGLARFDGLTFKVFDRSTSPALPGSAVINMFVDSQGRLWASTDDGLLCVDRGQWRVFREEQGWPKAIARSFVEDEDGHLLVSTNSERILRLDGARFVEFSYPRMERHDKRWRNRVSLIKDQGGQIWARKADSFWRLEQDQWTLAFEASDEWDFIGAAPSHDGGLWVAEQTHLGRPHHSRGRSRIRKWKGGRWVEERPREYVGELYVGLKEDSAGNLWAASYSEGLTCYRPDGTVLRYTGGAGLTHNSVPALFEDREGNIWAGTGGGGLLRFKSQRFATYSEKEGLPQNVVKSIAEEAPGTYWVGTHGGGLVRMENGRIESRSIPGIRPAGAFVWSVLIDRAGGVWAGLYAKGLHHVQGREAASIDLGVDGDLTVHSLYQDSSETIWVGTDRGLFRLPRNGAAPRGAAERLIDAKTIAIAEAPDGDLWAGSQGEGLFHLHDGDLTQYRAEDGVGSDSIWSLHSDLDGTLWVGTRGGGLTRLRQGEFTRFTENEGLPKRVITCILDDERGHLWLGTTKGVMRVSRQELEAVGEGQTPKLTPSIFTKQDGLRSMECSGGYQPTCIKDSQDRLWFGTVKGLAMVDLRGFELNSVAPLVAIERVVLDGGETNGGADIAVEIPGNPALLEIPTGVRRVEVYFTGLSLTAAEKVRFQYQLEGLDDDWRDVGTRRAAYFQDLAPGDYSFRVRAANNDGVWNEGGVSLPFVMLPFFWQTWWFQTLSACGIVFLVAGSAWRVARNKARRERESLERKRALAEEKLRHSEETRKLEASLQQGRRMEALGVLAGGVAHDFNNILTSMIGFADLAQASLPENSEEREFLEEVLRGGDRATDLVRRLLTYTRRGSQQRKPLDIARLVREDLKLLRASIPSTIEMHSAIGDDCGTVLADADELHRVVVNLCTNAYQAMEGSAMDGATGVLSVCLERVDLDSATAGASPDLHEGAYARLVIRDTGPGIDPEVLPHIFEPFFTTKQPGRGTGLGLSMVHGMVTGHGGAINVESKVGEGTEFAVYLPRLDQQQVEDLADTEPLRGGVERILVVDDEPGIVEVVKRSLGLLGYRVSAESSPAEALKTFESSPYSFDLVLTDLTMPGMTGLELAARFRGLRSDMLIIVASGFADRRPETEAGRANVSRWLDKPFTIHALGREVRDVLDESRRGTEQALAAP